MENFRGFSSSPSLFSVRQRRDKHVIVEEIDNKPLYFHVRIRNIHGIEPFRLNKTSSSLENNCLYFVALWVQNPASYIRPTSTVLETRKILSKSSDSFVIWPIMQEFQFKLDPAIFEWAELKLEVIRIGFGDEIGTSDGRTIVGRASIQISEVVVGKETRNYHVDLVRKKAGDGFECKNEGIISMDMKLSKEYRSRCEIGRR